MKQFTLLLLISFAAVTSINSQSRDITVHRNGLTFPNGKELTDPVNARTDIPSGQGVLGIYADISGIEGSVTFEDCVDCTFIYAFESYLFREIDDRGNPGLDLNKEFFVLSKKVDVTSDDLLLFLKTRQLISTIAIKVFTSDINGQMNLLHTITLNDSTVAEHRFELIYDKTTDETHLVEKYYFRYDSISYTGDGATVVLD